MAQVMVLASLVNFELPLLLLPALVVAVVVVAAVWSSVVDHDIQRKCPELLQLRESVKRIRRWCYGVRYSRSVPPSADKAFQRAEANLTEAKGLYRQGRYAEAKVRAAEGLSDLEAFRQAHRSKHG